MKKKLLWAGGILLLVVLVVVGGLSFLVKTYLKSDRLKAIIIPRIEARTGAKAEIDDINVSIFRGIVVKGIRLRLGERDFMGAGQFVLDYSLLPLLKKQLVINRVVLLSPYVHIWRDKGGAYNIAPLMEKPKGREEGEAGGLPVTLITEKIEVKDAALEFSDELGELPDLTAKADMALRLSLKEKLQAEGRLDLKALKAALGGVETDTSGEIEFDAESIRIDLKTALGKETVKITGSVRDYLRAPDLSLNLSAQSLDLDRLIPAGKGKGAGSGAKAKGQGGLPPLKANGEITVGTLRYGGYEIKDFRMGYAYSGGRGTIKPLLMNLAGGERVNAKGELQGQFQFAYTPGSPEPAETIKDTLKGEGTLKLGEGRIKASPLTSAVALFTGLEELREPPLGSADFDFKVKDRKVLLEGVAQSSLYRANPSGSVGMDGTLDLVMDLALAPRLTEKLPGRLAAYTADKEGWSSIPLRIRGTTGKPSVGLNVKGVEKKIEEKVKEKITEGIEKRLKPSGDKGSPSPEELIKGIIGK
jgi:AsmA protein